MDRSASDYLRSLDESELLRCQSELLTIFVSDTLAGPHVVQVVLVLKDSLIRDQGVAAGKSAKAYMGLKRAMYIRKRPK